MRRHRTLGIAVLLCVGRTAVAIEISGYDPTVNDRFASGFPSVPVPNTAGVFVGLPYDWSGVGWDTASPVWGFGFVTPRHYLVAQHWGGAATLTLRGADGVLHTATQASVVGTGYGMVLNSGPDLAVGRLTVALPAAWRIARYPVLDLNPSSTENGSYNARPLLVYGRGSSSPRIGLDSVASTWTTGPVSYITSSTAAAKLQVGDSGSPVFVPWTRPGGGPELAIVGNNAAVGPDNIHNLAASSGALAAINAITVPDGFALRMVGEAAATWQGGDGESGTGDDLGVPDNWSPAAVPTDAYAAFDGVASPTRAIDVDRDVNLRGLVFRPTGSGTLGFTFAQPTNVLTVGRGGIVNDDESRQVLAVTVALGDHQVWDVGPGGVTAAAIDTQGRLLEVIGPGTALFAGPVSGSGGLALSGGRMEIAASTSYSGATWVHAGTLSVSGTVDSSSMVVVDAGGTVAGSGRLPAISGAGAVDPGAGAGILAAAAIDGTGGLAFDFEFTRAGAPDWAHADSSGNDVLRITGASPFAAPLAASNRVRVFLDVDDPGMGTTFQGGFFTDVDAGFLPAISAATFTFFTADATGTTIHGGRGYAAYAGPLTFGLSTERVTADFAGGAAVGFVMQFVAVPEPSTAPLALAAALVLRRRARRCRPTAVSRPLDGC
jgi:hypothetical protein